MANENKMLKAMRQMAWERGKAEITSMLCTMYWESEESNKKRDEFIRLWKEFVKTVEYNGMQE